MNKKALLIVVSGPSGTGKGTICAELMRRQRQIIYSISCTTREPRPGDEEGKTYFFKTRAEFDAMVAQDGFLEYASFYNGQCYGTPRRFVEDTLASGRDCLLEVEPQGARQVLANMPGAISIYLLPPTMKELRRRLVVRGTEDEAKIDMRFRAAREEMSNMHLYHYCVVNESVGETVDVIESILTAERHRPDALFHHLNRLKEEEI